MLVDTDIFPQGDFTPTVEKLLGAIARCGRTRHELFLWFSDHGRMDFEWVTGVFHLLSNWTPTSIPVTIARIIQTRRR
jgi:hypothetical protein